MKRPLLQIRGRNDAPFIFTWLWLIIQPLDSETVSLRYAYYRVLFNLTSL